MNLYLEQYAFADAVTRIYDFWLKELCGVYLELIKPRFHSKTPDHKDIEVARDVLYTCLDKGLRLLHPIIPFVTEELYQRLPESPTKAESICVAEYPGGVISWENEKVEEKMEFARKITA